MPIVHQFLSPANISIKEARNILPKKTIDITNPNLKMGVNQP
jgi:hypothetical protein